MRLTAALGLCGVSSLASATNGYFQIGYGTVSKAMAGVAYALPQDALVIASNPAALSLLADRTDIGLDWINPRRTAKIEGNETITLQSADGFYRGDQVSRFLVPEFGYRSHAGGAWSYGVAVYGNGGLNTEYAPNPYAAFGSTGHAGVDFAQLFVSPAVAWRVTERASLGVAMNLVYQHFKAYGLDAFSTTTFPGPYSESPDHLTNQGYDDSFGIGYRLGALVEPLDGLTFGASWQPRTKMTRFREYRGLFPDQGSFDVPASYGAGLAWRWRQTVVFGFDVQQIDFAKVQSLGTPIQPLYEGVPIGSNRGPGFGWRSETVFKSGVGVQVLPSLRLMAGYGWGREPIPRSQTLFNILAPATLERHVTMGFTYRSEGPWRLSGYYCRALHNVVRGRDSIADNQLASPLPPASLGGGETDIGLAGKTGGFALSYAF